MLRHFDPTLPSILATDASDFALSAVLQQPDTNGDLHPVAYFSRKLTPAEINYDIHDKELLAIVAAFREMRAWLLGAAHPISVITDHNNLKYFMFSQVLNRHQARWAMFLSDYIFALRWGPGVANVADAPSRRADFVPRKGDDTLECQRKTILNANHTRFIFPLEPTNTISTASGLTTLSIDNASLLECVSRRHGMATSPRLRQFRLHRRIGPCVPLFVPKPLRTDILHSRHDSPTAGHPGCTRTRGFMG